MNDRRSPLEFKAVIFDMDGLMLDTERLARIAWSRALAEWGSALPQDVHLRIIGRAEPDVREILRHGLEPDLPIDEVMRRKQHYLGEDIRQNGIPVKPGLLPLLDWLDRVAVPKAVASSSFREHVHERLTRAGLLDRFDAFVGGDEIRHGKPAPDIFLAAAARVRVAAEQCVVLEDSDAGVRAAHAAGMVPLMVPDQKPPAEDVAALAYRIFPSLHEVQVFLQADRNADG